MTTKNHPDPYAPCHCGSGKKYKFCCLAQDREAARKATNTAPAPGTVTASPDDPAAADSQGEDAPPRQGPGTGPGACL